MEIPAQYMGATDAADNYSPVTAAVSSTTPSTGTPAIQLAVNNSAPAGASGRLVVWRKTGTGVLTAPDRFIVIPTNGRMMRLFDTGAHLNKRPWVTTGVPVPNTVAPAGDRMADVLASGSVRIMSGAFAPDNVLVGNVGDMYLRQGGGASSLFIKESSSGTSTGWVAQ